MELELYDFNPRARHVYDKVGFVSARWVRSRRYSALTPLASNARPTWPRVSQLRPPSATNAIPRVMRAHDAQSGAASRVSTNSAISVKTVADHAIATADASASVMKSPPSGGCALACDPYSS